MEKSKTSSPYLMLPMFSFFVSTTCLPMQCGREEAVPFTALCHHHHRVHILYFLHLPTVTREVEVWHSESPPSMELVGLTPNEKWRYFHISNRVLVWWDMGNGWMVPLGVSWSLKNTQNATHNRSKDLCSPVRCLKESIRKRYLVCNLWNL